jgi:Ca-activated chloride channel family protein
MTCRPDRRLIRAAGRSTRFLLVRLQAPAAERRADRLPLDVALVLDRSGSMAGEKIRLAREAVERSIRVLDDRDRVAVVVYDDRIDVVLPGSPATAETRRTAEARLREIDARGSTNLAGGWLTGCEQVAMGTATERVARTLLLTDGLANVGITDHNELESHARELRRRGIATTTFGVGVDFDESLLQALATAGGGNFYFISDARQIPDFVTSELGEVLETVAREAGLDIEAPGGVAVDVLGSYPLERRGGGWRVELGDLVSDQEVEVVLRLNFPAGSVGDEMGVRVTARDRDGVLAPDAATLRWEFADHRANDGQSRDGDVDRVVGRLFAARARQEAVALNRSGDFGKAADVLRRVGRRIEEYAGSDPELQALVTVLEREASHDFAVPMAARELKMRHFAASTLVRGRDALGRARRAPDQRT